MRNCEVCGAQIESDAGNFCDSCRDLIIEDLENLDIEEKDKSPQNGNNN